MSSNTQTNQLSCSSSNTKPVYTSTQASIEDLVTSLASTSVTAARVVVSKEPTKKKGGRPTLLTAWGNVGKCTYKDSKGKSCAANATYGEKTGRPIYCKEHIEKGKHMYLMDKCPCSPDRNRITWGQPGDKKASRCGKCKITQVNEQYPVKDINFAAKKDVCEECKVNRPKWGPQESSKRVRCHGCKLSTDTNKTNPKCMCPEGEGKTRVRKGWGRKGTKTALRCKWCKHDKDVQVTNRRCGCPTNNRPSHGPPDGKPVRCADCKLATDVNLTNMNYMCSVCPKDKAMMKIYGPKGSIRPLRCRNCKLPTDVNVHDKKCKCGSGIQPSFGKINGGKPFACSKCKTDDLVGTPAKQCKGLVKDGCACPFQQRGNNNYDGYCTACFVQNFPGDERSLSVKKKTHELKVRDFLVKTFPELPFIHDKPIHIGNGCDCTHLRRIDFRTLIENTLLCIECDEYQHKYNDQIDEKERYDDLYMAYSGKLIFIRFNPHPFLKNNVPLNPKMEDRLQVLEDEINTQIERIVNEQNRDLVEVHYLFYDELSYNQDSDDSEEDEDEDEDIDSDSE